MIKMATLAPDGSAWVQVFNELIADVKAKTDKNVEFRVYPEHNHLLIPGEGKCTPDEYQKTGHVDRAVIDDLAQWINKVKK